MGWGDELMGAGIARRNMREHGKRTAFGDGNQVIWSTHAHEIFRGNPNIVRPEEHPADVIWERHHRGSRQYLAGTTNGLQFVRNFRPEPGEIFFTDSELEIANMVPGDLVIIEPNVKTVYPNKQWHFDRYQQIASMLLDDGYRVGQLVYEGARKLRGVRHLYSTSFRDSAAMLARQRAYLGPEGGLHHASAAVGLRGVVIFGGFISPDVTGYEIHENVFVGENPCGSIRRCSHCETAMNSISVPMIYDKMRKVLR